MKPYYNFIILLNKSNQSDSSKNIRFNHCLHLKIFLDFRVYIFYSLLYMIYDSLLITCHYTENPM